MGNSATNFRVGPHRSGGQLVGWGWTLHLGAVHTDYDTATKPIFTAAVGAAKAGFASFDALLSSSGHPWQAAYLALSATERGDLCNTFADYGA